MAYKFTLEILLSEAALEACKRHDINIPKIAVNAVHAEIQLKQELFSQIYDLTPTLRNVALADRLKETMSELEEARKELREIMLKENSMMHVTPKMRLCTPVVKVFT